MKYYYKLYNHLKENSCKFFQFMYSIKADSWEISFPRDKNKTINKYGVRPGSKCKSVEGVTGIKEDIENMIYKSPKRRSFLTSPAPPQRSSDLSSHLFRWIIRVLGPRHRYRPLVQRNSYSLLLFVCSFQPSQAINSFTVEESITTRL